ncbi:RNB domain-containing ribonuclease [Microbacterium sp. VKM Ac-2870]|uniref:RNB domain-containing ribonuclease n=1 Tax=Microbacterium sp. VKM Ac-2870 TaxID=2783825 RepID=UPI00188B3C3F|nr:RNB domain-containing ribonuclease [Microbacterium sp. VKM Ac-2870]MBF4561833.1 RNB domain-containing ribonuclease [Microbacterium sp. VKM Ac-2870]
MPHRRSRFVPRSLRGELAASLAALRDELSLPAAYPADALREAEASARHVPVDPVVSGLVDLRAIEFLTIDPAGSTDLDQAVHLERTATGGILHYAIADVPAFVTPGGALDAETRRRGQTLYAPDGRIPLHPEALSEDAASLLPGRDRRAYVWRFVLDDGARPTETSITRAIVRSRRQWSYPEAQHAIDAGTAPPTLAALPWFGAARAERERERGGASLNLPETRIISRDDGTDYALERSYGVPLEDWNADVSLLTGMAAADIMIRGGVGILRTMPPARPDDLEEFRAQTVALGMPWHTEVAYGDYLRTLDRSPAARAVRECAAGLFRGAGYAAFDGAIPAQTAQAAIGAAYAHTTAPLRRLVDRWSLVICEALANGREVPWWARESLDVLPKIMSSSSARAGQLEAGSIDRVEAAVLTGHVGEEYDAVVVSRRGDGVRIQLSEPPVESTVKGLDARPGSTVRVRLAAASIVNGSVGFAPV